MEPFNIVEVEIVMANGIHRGPIELRANSELDSGKLQLLLDDAARKGWYNARAETLFYYALDGHELYWWNDGKYDREEFVNNPDNLYRVSTLYVGTDPNQERVRDLDSWCLCQNERTCRICRLQNGVKKAEAKAFRAGQEAIALTAARDALIAEHLREIRNIEMRAEIAEAENKKLLKQIRMLKRHNHSLRDITRGRSSTSPSEDDDHHPAQHRPGLGGKTRPEAEEHGEQNSDDKSEKNVGGDYSSVRKQATATFVQNGENSDSESITEVRKGAKRLWHGSDDDQDDDQDDDFHPTPQKRQRLSKARTSGRATKIHRVRALSNFAQGNSSLNKKAHIKGINSGRATNNSLGSFMDSNPMASITNLPKPTLARAQNTGFDDTAPHIPHASSTAATTATPTPPTTTSLQPQQNSTVRGSKGWSNQERDALIALVSAHRNRPVGPDGKQPDMLHDIKLFELMSTLLRQQGIDRSAAGCKNEWNRRARAMCGVDNRVKPNPSNMRTSLQ